MWVFYLPLITWTVLCLALHGLLRVTLAVVIIHNGRAVGVEAVAFPELGSSIAGERTGLV